MEIWKSIPNYEELYKISSLGNLLSLRNNKLLHPSKEHGYLKTSLRKDGMQKKFSIHQLVAMAFLGHIPCKHKLVVDHINENKLDNRLENLQIITNKENVVKSIKSKINND